MTKIVKNIFNISIKLDDSGSLPSRKAKQTGLLNARPISSPPTIHVYSALTVNFLDWLSQTFLGQIFKIRSKQDRVSVEEIDNQTCYLDKNDITNFTTHMRDHFDSSLEVGSNLSEWLKKWNSTLKTSDLGSKRFPSEPGEPSDLLPRPSLQQEPTQESSLDADGVPSPAANSSLPPITVSVVPSSQIEKTHATEELQSQNIGILSLGDKEIQVKPLKLTQNKSLLKTVFVLFGLLAGGALFAAGRASLGRAPENPHPADPSVKGDSSSPEIPKDLPLSPAIADPFPAPPFQPVASPTNLTLDTDPLIILDPVQPELVDTTILPPSLQIMTPPALHLDPSSAMFDSPPPFYPGHVYSTMQGNQTRIVAFPTRLTSLPQTTNTKATEAPLLKSDESPSLTKQEHEGVAGEEPAQPAAEQNSAHQAKTAAHAENEIATATKSESENPIETAQTGTQTGTTTANASNQESSSPSSLEGLKFAVAGTIASLFAVTMAILYGKRKMEKMRLGISNNWTTVQVPDYTNSGTNANQGIGEEGKDEGVRKASDYPAYQSLPPLNTQKSYKTLRKEGYVFPSNKAVEVAPGIFVISEIHNLRIPKEVLGLLTPGWNAFLYSNGPRGLTQQGKFEALSQVLRSYGYQASEGQLKVIPIYNNVPSTLQFSRGATPDSGGVAEQPDPDKACFLLTTCAVLKDHSISLDSLAVDRANGWVAIEIADFKTPVDNPLPKLTLQECIPRQERKTAAQVNLSINEAQKVADDLVVISTIDKLKIPEAFLKGLNPGFCAFVKNPKDLDGIYSTLKQQGFPVPPGQLQVIQCHSMSTLVPSRFPEMSEGAKEQGARVDTCKVFHIFFRRGNHDVLVTQYKDPITPEEANNLSDDKCWRTITVCVDQKKGHSDGAPPPAAHGGGKLVVKPSANAGVSAAKKRPKKKQEAKEEPLPPPPPPPMRVRQAGRLDFKADPKDLVDFVFLKKNGFRQLGDNWAVMSKSAAGFHIPQDFLEALGPGFYVFRVGKPEYLDTALDHLYSEFAKQGIEVPEGELQIINCEFLTLAAFYQLKNIPPNLSITKEAREKNSEATCKLLTIPLIIESDAIQPNKLIADDKVLRGIILANNWRPIRVVP